MEGRTCQIYLLLTRLDFLGENAGPKGFDKGLETSQPLPFSCCQAAYNANKNFIRKLCF